MKNKHMAKSRQIIKAEFFRKNLGLDDRKIFDTAFNMGYKKGRKRERYFMMEFYNEFDLASNCTKDDVLFKRLYNKYFYKQKSQKRGTKQ